MIQALPGGRVYVDAAASLAARRERGRARRLALRGDRPIVAAPVKRQITLSNKGCKPDLGITCEMYGFYKDGKTLAEVAAMFGIKRQGVWERFKRRGLPMRPDSKKKALPSIEFAGARYAPGKDNYFRKTSGDRSLLHWDMWEAARGPIKRGHEIRFIDGDRMNLVLTNMLCVRADAGKGGLGRTWPALKTCIACGQIRMPRLSGKYPEGPTAYLKRQTCDSTCSATWRRGRSKGARMPGN